MGRNPTHDSVYDGSGVTRLFFLVRCGIQITDANEDDTGYWYLSALATVNGNNPAVSFKYAMTELKADHDKFNLIQIFHWSLSFYCTYNLLTFEALCDPKKTLMDTPMTVLEGFFYQPLGNLSINIARCI